MSLSRREFHPGIACLGLGAGVGASDKRDAVEGQSGKRRGTRGRRVACGTWNPHCQGPGPSCCRSPAVTPSIRRASKNIFALNTRLDCSPPSENQSWPPNSRREVFFRSFQATLILGSFCFPFPFRPGPPAVELLPSPPTKTAQDRYLSSPRSFPKVCPSKKKPSAPKIQPTFATSINYVSTSAPVQSPVSIPANRILVFSECTGKKSQYDRCWTRGPPGGSHSRDCAVWRQRYAPFALSHHQSLRFPSLSPSP